MTGVDMPLALVCHFELWSVEAASSSSPPRARGSFRWIHNARRRDQSLRQTPNRVLGKAKRGNDKTTQKGVAECQKNKRECTLPYRPPISFAQTFHKIMQNLQDRIERGLVSGHHHPCRECTAPLLGEGVEGKIDNTPEVGLTGLRRQHDRSDPARDLLCELGRESGLQAGSATEMMQ